MFARRRTEINNPIGFADGFIVVLDDQNGVAQIAQTLERFEQSCIVARMQPNGRLIQHIQHADKMRADLSRQPNSLRFAAR